MNEGKLVRASFWKAVDNNDVETVSKLLQESADLVNDRFVGEAKKPNHIWSHELKKQVPTPINFKFTNTALHTATINSYLELAALLCKHGADVNDIGFEPD